MLNASLTTSNDLMDAQPPGALRVAAARGHLGRWRALTMHRGIACITPPTICPAWRSQRGLL